MSLLLAGAVLLAGFHMWSLTLFPPPNPDEAMEANHSQTLLLRGENVYSLFDDIFPPGFAPVATSFPNVLRPFFNAALAGAFLVGGVSLETGRLFSLACSGLTFLLACWLAWRRTRSLAAVSAAGFVLGLDPVFIASSHDVRPEAMLGLLGLASYACLTLAAERPEEGGFFGPGGRWALLAGLLAVGSAGVHTNGAGFILAAFAACVWLAPGLLPRLALGGLLAGVGLLWCVRPDRFLPGWVLFQGFFGYRPPYGSWGWNILGMAAGELGRWIGPSGMGHEPSSRLFAWTLALQWSLVLGVWLAGWRVIRDAAFRGLLVWIGSLALFYAVFFANKNPQYLSVFAPFLTLMLVEFLSRSLKGGEAPSGGMGLAAAGAAVLLLAAPFLAAPALIVLAHPCRDATQRWTVWAAVLAGLLPALCLRLFNPGALGGSVSLGLAALGSPAVLVVLALPLLAMLVGAAARACGAAWPERPLAVAALSVCLGALVACNGAEVLSRCFSGPRFAPVEQGLRRLVPPGAKVLGPQRLWLALRDRPYRDWNALAYSRWLTGSRDVRRLVAGWEPDILLADADFRRIFVKDGVLAGFADVPLRTVGVVDQGPGFGQPIEVLAFVRIPARVRETGLRALGRRRKGR
ncbi:MAG: hypothetical protein WC943_05880 [Elusimicrobiota bacterium]|jgi:4-amino-4-deoxy-L-arabinose transferase-like glycosyltransferase